MYYIDARLVALPYPVRGLSAVDKNGDPMIYLNARHTAEQHLRTYEVDFLGARLGAQLNRQTAGSTSCRSPKTSQATLDARRRCLSGFRSLPVQSSGFTLNAGSLDGRTLNWYELYSLPVIPAHYPKI